MYVDEEGQIYFQVDNVLSVLNMGGNIDGNLPGYTVDGGTF